MTGTRRLHYMGGCLPLDMLMWRRRCSHHAMPPTVVVGDRWRELWLERLKAAPSPRLDRHTLRRVWKHGHRRDYGASMRGARLRDDGRVHERHPPLLEHLECRDEASSAVGTHVPERGVRTPRFLQSACAGGPLAQGVDTVSWTNAFARVDRDPVALQAFYAEAGRWIAGMLASTSVETAARAGEAPDSSRRGWRARHLGAGRSQVCVRRGGMCANGLAASFRSTSERMTSARSLSQRAARRAARAAGFPAVRLRVSCNRPLALVAVRSAMWHRTGIDAPFLDC